MSNFKIYISVGDTQEEDGDDQDTLKETLLETNPYLLGMTIVVSIFHSVFEFLAFKNGKLIYSLVKSILKFHKYLYNSLLFLSRHSILE